MKRVLVLNPYIPTLGGGEKHMGYLCQFIEEYYNYDVSIEILVHNYHEENVFSDDYVTIDKINKTFGLNLQKTSIKKHELSQASDKLRFLKNKLEIERISKGYDIFINFMFFSKHCGKAKTNIYQCMFPPKRFVAEIAADKKIQKLLLKYFDARFYSSYDKFISNSQFTNHWLGTFWKNTDKNTVIYPPVFSKDDVLDNRYDENVKKNIIISVGRFFVADHSKRQLDMVRFFVNNQDVFSEYEYHLVGNVSTLPADIEYLDQIKELASKVNNVYIHERMLYADLMDLYKQAKIFWHATGYGINENLEPHKMEHFGITTVEAMSFGAVPVVINKGGQKETVEEGVNGFRWNDEEECVSKTKKLIEDNNLRIEMAKVSVARAKNYSIDEFYNQNRKVFHELQL